MRQKPISCEADLGARIDALIMAGGTGQRLRPLTHHTPKPLLPVGGRPILDHNIALLRAFGIENITVAVRYLKERIIEHIEEKGGARWIEEEEPMGTIGAARLLLQKDRLRSPNLLVMNADLLTDINIEAMYLRHLETEAWLTMAVAPYSVAVPFAVVDYEGDRVTGLTEKPTYHYYTNAGIYLLRREALEEIPAGEAFDATDLVERLTATGRRVSLFPIEGRWLDIGSPDDYRRACELAAMP